MTNKEKWIANWSEAFKKEEAKSPRTVGAVVIGNTVAVMTINTIDKPRIGVAKCSPDDNFDLDTGLAIAYCRMIGMSVPDYVLTDISKKSICDLKVGEHFQVYGRRYVKIEPMKKRYLEQLGETRLTCDCYCLDTGKIVRVYKDNKAGLVEPINFDN